LRTYVLDSACLLLPECLRETKDSIGGFIEDLCFYMYIRLSPYNIDVAASTVAFTVQMLLKKPADCYRYGSRQVGVPNQFSSRSHLVKKHRF